jgi:tripartite-type tricarboxylate transporter receptor subunit TctC
MMTAQPVYRSSGAAVRKSLLAVALVSMSLPFTVAGQNYPSHPVRMVSSAAGGPADFAARVLATGLSGVLGQQVIVDNRRGSVVVSSMIVASAPPDGYTLIFRGSTFWMFPLLEKTEYDPVNDFAPISLVTRQPSLLVVHPRLPVKSVRDLIALAKVHPGDLNYGNSGNGSLSHLAMELFKSMAGINIVTISYSSTQGAMLDLFSGQTQVMIANASAVAPHMQSGRLKGLAVTSAAPSPFAPGLPTIAASGLPGYEAELLQGLFAPARTPPAVINRLNADVARVLENEDVKSKLLASGVSPAASTPAELGAMIKSEMARMGKVIKEAGLHAD